MSNLPIAPELFIRLSDGNEVAWNGNEFYGSEKAVAVAVMRCESMFGLDSGHGFIYASRYSLEGAILALTGSIDISDLHVESIRAVDFSRCLLPASVGTWHER